MNAVYCFKKICFLTECSNEARDVCRHLRLGFWLLLVHLLLMSTGLTAFFALLYGPLLVCAARRSFGKQTHRMILPLHVLPFVFCSASLFVEAIRWEPTAIFMINLISLCGYGMYLSLLNRGQRDADYREWLVSSKFFLTILAAIQLLAIVDHIADLPFSFSPDIAIVVLLFTAMTFLVKTLVSERESPGEVAESDARELAVQRECPEADRCLISRIENYFDNNLAYLEPSFDLQTLADEIDVPKAQISSVINKEMNKNFYVLLAEYRIEHAKSLLIKQDYLFTIESVIYECGFNSKSSFHKHFKQLVGSTPSNYRDDYFSQHRREKA